MDTARRITRTRLLRAQREMISFLENRGKARTKITAATGVPVTSLEGAMREASVLMSTERFERLQCYAIANGFQDAPSIPASHVAYPVPALTVNGCTSDEVLDGAEIIGRTRFDSLRGDWEAVLDYGWLLIQVGWRLVMEARTKMGHAVPVAPLPAPLFEFAGDGQ